MTDLHVPIIYLTGQKVIAPGHPLDGQDNPVRSLLDIANDTGIKREVGSNEDYRIFKGITDYRFLSFANVKGLTQLGILVQGYPLYAHCAAAELDKNTPNVLPGFEITELDNEGVEVTIAVKLKDWLAARNHTTQTLTNGDIGFGLPNEVTIDEAIALDGLSAFTVVDQIAYQGLQVAATAE